jgi:hypothetical protein
MSTKRHWVEQDLSGHLLSRNCLKMLMARVLTVETAEIACASAQTRWWLRLQTADRDPMYIYMSFDLSLLCS